MGLRVPRNPDTENKAGKNYISLTSYKGEKRKKKIEESQAIDACSILGRENQSELLLELRERKFQISWRFTAMNGALIYLGRCLVIL